MVFKNWRLEAEEPGELPVPAVNILPLKRPMPPTVRATPDKGVVFNPHSCDAFNVPASTEEVKNSILSPVSVNTILLVPEPIFTLSDDVKVNWLPMFHVEFPVASTLMSWEPKYSLLEAVKIVLSVELKVATLPDVNVELPTTL